MWECMLQARTGWQSVRKLIFKFDGVDVRNKSSSMRWLPYRRIAENIFAKSKDFLELDTLIRYNL